MKKLNHGVFHGAKQSHININHRLAPIYTDSFFGNLSQIMQHINGAYTTYFNIKRQRSGYLFRGEYGGLTLFCLLNFIN